MVDGEFIATSAANSGGIAGTLARLVVEKDAYVLLHPALPENIRLSITDKFGYIVVRGREPYTDGGIMRGYQLVDRIFSGTQEDLRIAALGRRRRGAEKRRLKMLNALKAEGLLTDEEYASQRARIISEL